MSEERVVVRENADGVRLLNTRKLLSHNRHVKDGLKTRTGCSGCASGLGTVDTVPQIGEPKADVDEGDGVDKDGDSASAPAGRWPWDKTGKLLSAGAV